MDLGNPSKTVVHYLLIEGMICFSHWDGFSHDEYTSIYDAYWIGPMVNDNVRISIVMIH